MKKTITLLTSFLFFVTCINAQAIKTELRDSAGIYTLYRGGLRYEIKGAATNNFLTTVSGFGGNTIRTYSVNDSTAAWLDSAYAHGIAVCLGLGIKKGIQMNYNDTGAVNTQFRLMRSQVLAYKDHPAVLMWAIGNETDASYPATDTALWEAVNDIAAMIHTEDTNHLTTTVLVNSEQTKVAVIKAQVPQLDILSINSYAPNIPGVLGNLQAASWTKPYMITEFGPRGTWQMNPEPTRIMPWGALVEQTSTEKAAVYKQIYEDHIAGNRNNNCLGGFVFVWGYQSSGDVVTWFGLFNRLGESFGAADEMQYVWTGAYPTNHAPVISSRNDFLMNGKNAEDTVIVEANSANLARVTASDPDSDPLTYEWLLIPEGSVMSGGSPSASLPSLTGFITAQAGDSVHFQAPATTGYYRLYAYVHDGQGKLASAVIPFKVIPSATGRMIATSGTGGNWTAAATWQGGIVPSNADTVSILSGSTVTINTSPVVACTQLSGTLTFNTTATNTFTTGDLNINTGGNFNAYNGTTGRKVTVNGNLVNNGTVNFSKTGTVLTMGQATDSTKLGGTGTYTTGIIRSLTIDNTAGVRLAVAASIPSILSLQNGTFRNGASLTMDNTVVGGSGASTFCTIQRTQSATLESTYTLGITAALYVVYNNTIANTAQAITEGYEIPASRSFHNITINNPLGVTLTNDVTLKSSNSAIVLTDGIIHLSAGKTLLCNNTAYPGVPGSSSSFVDGSVALTSGATAVTRTFPIGSAGENRKVVVSGLASVSGALTVKFGIDTATGTPGTGMSELSAARRWSGTVQSGTLGQYTAISINYGTDDGTGLNRLARSGTQSGVYNALPAGTVGSGTITSGSSAYSGLGWFAIGIDSSMFRSMMVIPSMINITPDEGRNNDQFIVYPNPVKNQVRISLKKTGTGKAQIVLRDITGRAVGTRTVDRLQLKNYLWQLSAKPAPGIYILSIRGNGLDVNSKIIVE
jgi:hypothetical protein